MAKAVYPFDASANPRLTLSKAKWAVILCNANYKYFLSARFPEAKWYWLGPDTYWHNGGLMLAHIPVTETNRPVLSSWMEANQQLHSITSRISFDQNGNRKQEILNQLLGMEGSFEKDPYLESIYWERVIMASGQNRPPVDWLKWIQNAIEKGYPCPHLLVAEGLLLNASGQFQASRGALQRALRSPFNLTNAGEILERMDGGHRKNPSPGEKP